jgi:phosphoacetylglucosamine mutase
MLDGDRIAILALAYIRELVKSAGFTDEDLRIGIVQTAYANGAATRYAKEHLGVEVSITNTGVKHLHHAAAKFDIGVYFEANGHGTVLFGEEAAATIKARSPKSPAEDTALGTLKALMELINQTVGDALSDMLMVEVILARKGMTIEQWFSTYVDLPNRLVAVAVRDRNVFKAVDAERKLESPVGIQARINDAVAKFNMGRAFARASGTEDAVRVYAEAGSAMEADALAQAVVALVQEYGQ